MDVPSPAAGTVAEVKVKVGDKVSEGSLILMLQTGEAKQAAPELQAPPPAAARAVPKPAERGQGRLPRRGAGAGRRPRRLHRGLPRRRPRQEGGAGRALADARRGLPQCRLHPVQGPAARRQGDRRDAATWASTASPSPRPQIDIDKLRGWKDGVVKRLTGGLAGLAKARKVTTLPGRRPVHRRRTSSRSSAADGGRKTVSFEQAIIAAGSEPVTLPFIPHDDPRVIDSTGALELDGVPKRLLVDRRRHHRAGDGDRLPRAGLEGDHRRADGPDHPRCRQGHRHPAAQADRQAVRGHLPQDQGDQGRGRRRTASPSASRAARRRRPTPSTGSWSRSAGGPTARLIGAENAGVAVDERGFIPVDRQMRTNVPHIFAIGDVVGQPMLAHKAVHEGKVAAEVAAGQKSFFDAKVIPSVAYTDPEVAWVGLTENEAQGQGRQVRQGRLPLGRLGPLALARAATRASPRCCSTRRRHRIIGCGIVGPNAGDLIAEAGARDRDGSGRRRHRPHHPPAPDACPRPSAWRPRCSRAPSPT